MANGGLLPYNLRKKTRLMPKETDVHPLQPWSVPTQGHGEQSPAVGLETRKNPMDNEYILVEVFRNLAFDDLKECRLVNSIWNHAATRELSPKTALIQFRDKSPPTRMARLIKLLKTVQTSWNFPCSKLEIGDYLFYRTPHSDVLMLSTFVEAVASTVTHLKIITERKRLFPGRKPAKHLHFPKLKSLDLFIFKGWRQRGSLKVIKANVDFMIEVLKHAPKLESISLNIGSADDGFHRVLDNVPWKQIRHFRLKGQVLDAVFGKILDLETNIKLTSFQLVTLSGAVNHTRGSANGVNFERFMKAQENTLETFKLRIKGLQPFGTTFYFPVLRKLKNLEVYLYEDEYISMNNIPMITLQLSSLVQRFPALESYSGSMVIPVDKVTMETVRELKLDVPTYNWELETDISVEEAKWFVRVANKVFPNIKKLTIPAHYKLTYAIEEARAWQSLEELTLICDSNEDADSALTGYTLGNDNHAQVLKMVSRPRTTRSLARLETEAEEYIFEFLQKIKVLEISCEKDYHSIGISDVSCRLVLLKLKNLKCLNIKPLGVDKHQVSEPMIREMSKKFEVLYKAVRKHFEM